MHDSPIILGSRPRGLDDAERRAVGGRSGAQTGLRAASRVVRSQTMNAPRPKIANARQAERAVVHWMHDLGYVDAVAAEDGAPDGVDVVAYSGLAQVRFGDAPVRRSELLKLEAAREGRSEVALFAVTSSKFEMPALTYADAKNILLFQLMPDGSLEPRSASARVLLGGPSAAVARPGSAGVPGFQWFPVLRHVPLVLGAYFLAVALFQGLRLPDGAGPGAVAFSALFGAALVALWFFVTRRMGTAAAPPDGSDPGPDREA